MRQKAKGGGGGERIFDGEECTQRQRLRDQAPTRSPGLPGLTAVQPHGRRGLRQASAAPGHMTTAMANARTERRTKPTRPSRTRPAHQTPATRAPTAHRTRYRHPYLATRPACQPASLPALRPPSRGHEPAASRCQQKHAYSHARTQKQSSRENMAASGCTRWLHPLHQPKID